MLNIWLADASKRRRKKRKKKHWEARRKLFSWTHRLMPYQQKVAHFFHDPLNDRITTTSIWWWSISFIGIKWNRCCFFSLNFKTKKKKIISGFDLIINYCISSGFSRIKPVFFGENFFISDTQNQLQISWPIINRYIANDNDDMRNAKNVNVF